MSFRVRLAVFLLLSLALVAVPETARAQGENRPRLALVLGVAGYKDGVQRLKGPRNDAQRMKEVLEHPDLGFKVTLLDEGKITSKSVFMAALSAFMKDVPTGAEVIFYFSGHGFSIDGGNYFLLSDSKSQRHFVDSLSKDRSNALKDETARSAEYRKWLKETALSEDEIAEEIHKKAEITFLIADACRHEPKKGFVPFKDSAGITTPKETKTHVFRWYAASPGQAAYDVLEDEATGEEAKSPRSSTNNRSDSSSAGRSDKDAKRSLSLFTSILAHHLLRSPIEFLELEARVKRNVIDRSNLIAEAVQQPHLVHGMGPRSYFFNRNRRSMAADATCSGAQRELDRLRTSVLSNSATRADIERARDELTDCGLSAQIDELLNALRQGVGTSIYAEDGEFPLSDNQLQEAVVLCDRLASSPFDPDRIQQHPPADIQQFALRAVRGSVDLQLARERIQSIANACTAAVKERPRNARYRYNRGRAYNALATISGPLVDRTELRLEASTSLQEAADAGYSAAFNDLAAMHSAGHYHAIVDGVAKALPADAKTATSLLQRGANLGHAIAQYNLGMAIRNGDAGTDTPSTAGVTATVTTREARAFEFISKSAEQGYMQAIIETALALHNGRGVQETNYDRALTMLELAASRGSTEAMYYLGEIFRIGYGKGDPTQAVLWHARAAEAGGTSSQEKLAEMLSEGEGIPVVESNAAGRYWRLAADGGNRNAQYRLALLLRDGKVRPRPRLDTADNGAQEIHDLLLTAFKRGEPRAGLELARLFRKGFPENRPAKPLQKDPGRAVQLLLDTITAVRDADPYSRAANPLNEYDAAIELMSMYETGDSRRGSQNMITDDQYEQLQAEYGKDKQRTWIRAAAASATGITCVRKKYDYQTPRAEELWVLVWNSKGSRNPAEQQFDWYERVHRCTVKHEDNKTVKPENLGVSQAVREAFRREYESWLQDKDAKKTYVDRMVELVNKGATESRGGKNRRR